MNNMLPIIAITMGDPSGIGPEIVAQSLNRPEVYLRCRPIVTGDAQIMRLAVDIVAKGLKINAVKSVAEARFEYGTVDVLDLGLIDMSQFSFGALSAQSGRAAFESVRKAIELAMAGEVDATVTAPLNKEALHSAGYDFAGHTEIYAHFTHTDKYAMLLADEHLRIIHVSTHVPLRKACDLVKRERIVAVAELLRDACLSFGIENPRLGIAGLNPHASDGGLFGDEERLEIAPAVEQLRSRGFCVEGPVPPDTLFSRARSGQFDGCVAMYHDQGHIPFKVAGFEWDQKTQRMTSVKGVNITLGLPIIRVSVDHGTAFDVAGKGIANPDALLLSIDYAIKMAKNRKQI